MRRLLSILLLAAFALPLAAPLLAMSGGEDAGLPACCRRSGRHHCAMGMAIVNGRNHTDQPQFRAPMRCCSQYGTVSTVFHPDATRPSVSQCLFAALLSHPAVHAQVESHRRVAAERARQKRGPPAPLLS